jgi:hypothetical protein
MSKGFKKIPFEQRAGLLTLKGARLHVWLAHYLRSDKDDEIEISNPQLVRETGYDLSTVKIAKRWLKENGWLVVDREAYRGDNGEWVTPVFKAMFAEGGKPNLDSDEGGKDTFGPGLKTQPRSRAENTAAGKSAPSVDTGFRVDTAESDASRLPVNTETEEVEDSSSASDVVSPERTDDELMEGFKRHSVETELLPIAKDYNLNGDCHNEAAKLYDVLKGAHFPGSNLGAAIEYFRSISDTFIADRISTWPGLLKMLRSGGMIQQFRSAQKLALKLNPKAYHAAQEEGFGTPAYGATLAKIIEDKKARKKPNPAYRTGQDIAKEVPSALERKFCPHGVKGHCNACMDDNQMISVEDVTVDEL